MKNPFNDVVVYRHQDALAAGTQLLASARLLGLIDDSGCQALGGGELSAFPVGPVIEFLGGLTAETRRWDEGRWDEAVDCDAEVM